MKKSTIRELLDYLDRRGWKWKSLGEVIDEIYIGAKVTKNHLGTGNCSCVCYHEIGEVYEACINSCISSVDETLIKEKR